MERIVSKGDDFVVDALYLPDNCKDKAHFQVRLPVALIFLMISFLVNW